MVPSSPPSLQNPEEAYSKPHSSLNDTVVNDPSDCLKTENFSSNSSSHILMDIALPNASPLTSHEEEQLKDKNLFITSDNRVTHIPNFIQTDPTNISSGTYTPNLLLSPTKPDSNSLSNSPFRGLSPMIQEFTSSPSEYLASDLPSSSPVSSPPQIFSSSPLASSQSSEAPEDQIGDLSDKNTYDEQHIPPVVLNDMGDNSRSLPPDLATSVKNISYLSTPSSSSFVSEEKDDSESDDKIEYPSSDRNIAYSASSNTLSPITPEISSLQLSTDASRPHSSISSAAEGQEISLDQLPILSPSGSSSIKNHKDNPIEVDSISCRVHVGIQHGPLPFEKVPDLLLSVGKRKRVDGDAKLDSRVSVQHDYPAEGIFAPNTRTEAEACTNPPFPNPKRSTVASQKQQHKKLVKPFRSPVLKRPKLDQKSLDNRPTTGHLQVTKSGSPKNAVQRNAGSSDTTNMDMKKRYRTQRAASQFKSPLSVDTASRVIPSVRLTPTIQALERKLQILKRAAKVKQDGDEKALGALVKKWTEAGREVAWEVWELVKDNASNGNENWNQPKDKPGKQSFEEGWGWGEKGGQKHTIGEEGKSWGWDDPNGREYEADQTQPTSHGDTEYDEEKRQDTLGTMLIQLGIAPDTLGWNEEEGTFTGD